MDLTDRLAASLRECCALLPVREQPDVMRARAEARAALADYDNRPGPGPMAEDLGDAERLITEAFGPDSDEARSVRHARLLAIALLRAAEAVTRAQPLSREEVTAMADLITATNNARGGART